MLALEKSIELNANNWKELANLIMSELVSISSKYEDLVWEINENYPQLTEFNKYDVVALMMKTEGYGYDEPVEVLINQLIDEVPSDVYAKYQQVIDYDIDDPDVEDALELFDRIKNVFAEVAKHTKTMPGWVVSF